MNLRLFSLRYSHLAPPGREAEHLRWCALSRQRRDTPVLDISAQHYPPGFQQQQLESSRSPAILTQERTRMRRLRQLQRGYGKTDFLTYVTSLSRSPLFFAERMKRQFLCIACANPE